jgi:hypothetical protein
MCLHVCYTQGEKRKRKQTPKFKQVPKHAIPVKEISFTKIVQDLLCAKITEQLLNSHLTDNFQFLSLVTGNT